METNARQLWFSSRMDNTQLKADADKTKASLKEIGDTAKVEGAKIESAFDQASQNGFKSFNGMTTNLKQQIQLQQQLIREIAADIRNYQNELGNTTNPKLKSSLEGEIAGGKRALVEANGQLIAMQRQQVEGNMKEEESQGSLIGSLGKWALGLATVAAAIKIGKAIIESTATGVEFLETALNQASAATHYFFQSINTGNFDNFGKGMQIAIEGAKKFTEEMERVQNMRNQDLVTTPQIDKEIADAYIEITNRAGKDTAQQLKDIDDYLGLIKTKYKPLIETAKDAKDAILGSISTRTGGQVSTDQLETFISKYRDYEEMLKKGARYNVLQDYLTQNTGPQVNVAGGTASVSQSASPLDLQKARDEIKALGSDAKEAGKYVSQIMLVPQPARAEAAKAINTYKSLIAQQEETGKRMQMRRGTLKAEELKQQETEAKEANEEALKLAGDNLKYDTELEQKRVDNRIKLQELEVKAMADGNEKLKAQANVDFLKEYSDIQKRQAAELLLYNQRNGGIDKKTGLHTAAYTNQLPAQDQAVYDAEVASAVQVRAKKIESINKNSVEALKKVAEQITANTLSQSEKEIEIINDKFDKIKELAIKNGATQEALANIELARTKAIETAKNDAAIKATEFYKRAFGDISSMGFTALQKLATEIQGVLSGSKIENKDGKSYYIVSIPDVDAEGKAVTKTVNLTIEEFNALQNKYSALVKVIKKENVFKALIDDLAGDDPERKLKALATVFNDVSSAVGQLGDVFSQTDIKFGVSIKNITGYLSGAAQIAEGAATKNPTAIISGVISVGDSVFKMLSHESAGAEQFTAKLKEVTKELEKQQTVIERSARTGYQNAALQQEIELLKKQKDLNDAAIKAEYGKTGHFLGISWDATSYVKIEQITAENDAISKQIADSQQQLDDLKLGNITQNTLADSIAQAFNDGKTSVDDFATYMNKVLLDAALNIFKAQYLLPAINDQLMPVITAALADNVLSKDEKANIDAVTKGIADKNKGIWDGLTGALGLGATTRTASSSGLASMSQDTGNELNGRFTAIQGHTFNINEGMKILQSNSQQALQHLAGIETNTARLEAIQNGIDTINLKGIILKK